MYFALSCPVDLTVWNIYNGFWPQILFTRGLYVLHFQSQRRQ